MLCLCFQWLNVSYWSITFQYQLKFPQTQNKSKMELSTRRNAVEDNSVHTRRPKDNKFIYEIISITVLHRT
jgi:hypothetical protein